MSRRDVELAHRISNGGPATWSGAKPSAVQWKEPIVVGAVQIERHAVLAALLDYEPRPERPRMHVVGCPASRPTRVDAAIAAGGTVIYAAQAPD